ncbi:hypothetical protein [Mycobacteroides abscessus]|uniref:hypothetical protein n=1 Tax=Mycobacteroides abscessus TaxID=36809 RepID=UPI0009A889F6|nr:hypothetical protein [Mycobacteroides abscessus]SKF80151.1 Uncharacterised protein [Mycobacteroides abscessus subsp. bolletii]SKG59432.1 Uncharacterised protein [Mycobacteroides abscessus subsp. bolletii]SKG80740.1 Uncharacterised protein [Mycobacteroides abscessus subsp. bolletii]SKG96785.1 Uncharacterised protein [Mycobacteroides abscessus subsp. bolletii]SKH23627.1 Uncharacterised protein [Mycobacteroides abscessus subsp. bolletii]
MTASGTSRAFQAKYPDQCEDCDEPVNVGDWVRYVDDALIHTDCPNAAPPAAITDVCGKCWTVHAGGCL